MTSHRVALLAATALITAILAVAARPLLPHPHARPAPRDSGTAPSIPRLVAPIAGAAAIRALACPARRAATGSVDCGTVHLTRQQTHCPSDTRCQVELVGTLRTRTDDVPVALTVTLTAAAGQWWAVEVTS
jgi:hypothetical protein